LLFETELTAIIKQIDLYDAAKRIHTFDNVNKTNSAIILPTKKASKLQKPKGSIIDLDIALECAASGQNWWASSIMSRKGGILSVLLR